MPFNFKHFISSFVRFATTLVMPAPTEELARRKRELDAAISACSAPRKRLRKAAASEARQWMLNAHVRSTVLCIYTLTDPANYF